MKPTGLSARYCKWIVLAAFLANVLACVFLHVFRTDNRPSVHEFQLLQRL